MSTSTAGERASAVTPELLARLSALAEEKRLRILDILRGGEHCVCDLTDLMEAGQSLLSHHLKVLRDAGLVTDRRAGRWSYYRLVPDALAEVESFVGMLRADAERAEAARSAPAPECC